MVPNFFVSFELFYKFVNLNDVIVLFLDCDTGLVEMDHIITIFVLFAKCMLTLPNGRLFPIDLKFIFYESSTSIQNNRKAVKTSQLLKRILDVLD